MAKKDTKSGDHSSSYEKAAIILIWSGLAIGAVATVLYSLQGFFPIINARFGQYGELVGGIVGSLWALAGVILFYEGMIFQRNELKMQRHELELQRHEIIEQTEQYKMQNEFIAIQMFENTFFQLMSLHNEIVESINMDINEKGVPDKSGGGGQKIIGRDCFVEYYRIYKRFFHFSFEEIRISELDDEMARELINNSYVLFFEESQADLGHYFRNLYAIIRFVDKSKIKDKGFYIDLVRAHLSNYELILLFFHCLSSHGRLMKPLVEKYAMLQNLPHDELIQMTKHLFGNMAFEIS